MSSAHAKMPRRYRPWVSAGVVGNCYDGLGTPTQLNGALNLGGGANASQWGTYTNAQTLASSDMVMHQGVPWVVHVDPVDAADGDGPCVQYWDGAAWVDAGFPSWSGSYPTPNPGGGYSHPVGCAIASDGASIFIAFESVYYNCGTPDLPPDLCDGGACDNQIDHRTLMAWTSHVPTVWKWDGATWSFMQSWGPQETGVASDGVLNIPVGFEWILVANLAWEERASNLFSCPIAVAPVGDQLARPLLAAKDDDFILVWRQSWREWTLITVDTGCVGIPPDDECLITTDKSSVDSTWYGALNSDGSRTDYGFYPDVANNGGPKDIIWDVDTAVPLLLHYTGEIGQEAWVMDATDGTVLQTQADTIPARFSSPWNGLRYISGRDQTVGGDNGRVWQIPSDASGGFDSLDGDITFMSGARFTGRPLPEDFNVWLLALNNSDRSQPDQFNRNCNPKFWAFPGYAVPTGLNASNGPNYRTDLLGEFIYISYLNGNAGVLEHQVWQVPICRCCVSCPTPAPIGCVNDDFANATLLVGASGSDDNCTAMEGNTTEASEPVGSCLSNGIHHTVWFEWVAPASANVTFDTSSSPSPTVFDTTLTVYTGTNFGDMVEVACNDDEGGFNVTSTVTFAATMGTTYWIQVGLFADDITGALVLSWNQP